MSSCTSHRAPRKGQVRALGIVAIGIVLACEPIVGAPSPTAPVNACPAHPCVAYQQPGPAPTCNAGVCTVAATTTDLLLVIGLATDSFLAPGRTYVATLNSPSPAPPTCQGPTCCQLQANCVPPHCALPHWTQEESSYFIAPNGAVQANWNLGNAGVATTLPVQATFRFLYSPPGSSSPVDALDVGLPVEPVLANNVQVSLARSQLGPNGSVQLQFQTYLPPGCYERTLQPFSPFSRAFPPEIEPWSSPRDDDSSVGISSFDLTKATTDEGRVLPQFDFQRAEGLDGWTAYLRNAKTKRVFSNVVPLTGSLANNVTLLTKHVPSDMVDALTGLEVVLAPPSGQPLPTEFFAPTVANSSIPGMAPALVLTSMLPPYPLLPTPVTVSGRIRAATDEAPVPADVYFTATDISDQNGQKFPPNFEFSTHVTTTRDPHSNASTYSVLLPQGHYQIVVRPTDGVNAIKIAPPRPVGGQGNEMTGEDFYVTPLAPVSGRAIVADGRPLAEAIVELLPTQCFTNAGDAAAAADSSAACLPNATQTVTDSDGSFRLTADPGGYLLRVRPRDGSRLPWTISPITVGTALQFVPVVHVPAPISVGIQLTDNMTNAVRNAVVRVFTDPSQGAPAVELGRAVTDADGNYEMYIAPLDQ